MFSVNELSALLSEQYARYPQMTVRDMVKAIYQAEFGCGHFVSNENHALQLLAEEEQSVNPQTCTAPFIEPIGSDFCRVHIARMREKGLSVRTLCKLFMLSAQPAGDLSDFRFLLNEMLCLIKQGKFKSIDADQAFLFLTDYISKNCPPVHHSKAFRAAYAPAYRVIRTEFTRFLPLLCAIDQALQQKERVTVAIEGGSASGKSTLGNLLAQVYDCNLFHMDDFFLQPHQRTEERFAEIGGNVDYERFRTEVLDPLSEGVPFSYRVFDCSTMSMGNEIHIEPKKLNIIEGAYSMHPHFNNPYDLSAFMYVDSFTQKIRILERNGRNMLRRFVSEWIPLEEAYFEGTRVYEKCTFVL